MSTAQIAGPVKVWLGRDTTITIRLGEAQPVGATFESQIRVDDEPTSALLGTWAIDDTAATTTGVLVLTMPVANLASPLAPRKGVMDIVRKIGVQRVPVVPSLAVVFRDLPTVPTP